MSGLFHKILVEPLLISLLFFYQTIALQDLGVAIVLLTIVVRLILFPLFYKSLKTQAVLQKLRPEIARIQDQHKNNREKQAQAMMGLYKEHRVNPFTSFFLLLIQLPILIALYQVFLNPPSQLNRISLGLIDLKETSIIVVVLAALLQYFLGYLMVPKTSDPKDPQAQMAKKMLWLGPVMTTVFLAYLPSAVGVYWLTTAAFSIVQQWYINKKVFGYGKSSTDNPKSSATDRLP